jgi:antitoxin component of MazEF toxin-antitoxin module
MDCDSQFDAKIRENGNSKIITIPIETIEKLALKLGDILEVGIKKTEKRKK